MAKTISIPGTLISIVDDIDYEFLSHWKWHLDHDGYPVRQTSRKLRNGKRTTIFMHREIMKPTTGTEVDHINGDKLDNRRCNLRVCTHAENIRNSKKRFTNTSGYKGLVWVRHMQKWQALITINGIRLSLGFYELAEDAAHAYDDAARKYHGEFAKTNF